jgi:hypothetical protein
VSNYHNIGPGSEIFNWKESTGCDICPLLNNYSEGENNMNEE